jgi:hypothetical protein
MSLPFELIDEKPWYKTPIRSTGRGLKSLGGGLLRFPFQHPYKTAIGGGLFYAGDAMMGDTSYDSVYNAADAVGLTKIPVIPYGQKWFGDYNEDLKEKTDDSGWVTWEEYDNTPLLSATDQEANQYFNDSGEMDDLIGAGYTQDEINKIYTGVRENNMAVNKAKYDAILDPPPPTAEVPAAAPEDSGLFGDFPIQELYMLNQLMEGANKNTAPQIASMDARRGLQLEEENLYKNRRGIMG